LALRGRLSIDFSGFRLPLALGGRLSIDFFGFRLPLALRGRLSIFFFDFRLPLALAHYFGDALFFGTEFCQLGIAPLRAFLGPLLQLFIVGFFIFRLMFFIGWFLPVFGRGLLGLIGIIRVDLDGVSALGLRALTRFLAADFLSSAGFQLRLEAVLRLDFDNRWDVATRNVLFLNLNCEFVVLRQFVTDKSGSVGGVFGLGLLSGAADRESIRGNLILVVCL